MLLDDFRKSNSSDSFLSSSFFFKSFRTRFDCIHKDQQNMFADLDWCNIYHVCIGSRDNIFLCPPGTIFNDTKQGCMDRYDGTNCNGTRSYYKPTPKREKRIDPTVPPTLPTPPRNFYFANFKENALKQEYDQRIPYEWRKPPSISREVCVDYERYTFSFSFLLLLLD